MWNPYHQKIEEEFEVDSNMTIHVTRPDGKQVKVPPNMMRIVENEEIFWGGEIHGIFFSEHSFLLEMKYQNTTLLKHNEDSSGIAIGFADLPPDVITEGYDQMNISLKELLEQ